MVWDSLAASEKTSFLSLITSFPNDPKLIKNLVNQSTIQFRQAFGSKHSVAIIGPANVGNPPFTINSFTTRRTRLKWDRCPGPRM